MQQETQTTFLLPIAVVSPMDVARLVRELKNLEEYFSQNTIRTGEAPQVPRYSRLLDAIVVANKVDLVEQSQRIGLMERFKLIQKTAPVMHISFSTDPPGAYVQKIVAWLRENIDPLLLVRVGLQPNIGAGCIVRTTNKAFDFSLRKYFDSKHEFFMSRLHEVVSENNNEVQPAVENKVLVDAEVEKQSDDEAKVEVKAETAQVAVEAGSGLKPETVNDSEATAVSMNTSQEEPVNEVSQPPVDTAGEYIAVEVKS